MKCMYSLGLLVQLVETMHSSDSEQLTFRTCAGLLQHFNVVKKDTYVTLLHFQNDGGSD